MLRKFESIEEQRRIQQEMGSNFNLFCPLCGAILLLELGEGAVDIIKHWGGLGFTAYCDCGWYASQHF